MRTVSSGPRPGTKPWTAPRPGFQQSIDRHGPDSFGMFSCSKATNEVNFLAQKFTRVAIGTNNIDSCNRT